MIGIEVAKMVSDQTEIFGQGMKDDKGGLAAQIGWRVRF